jgi:hypothetical protein
LFPNNYLIKASTQVTTNKKLGFCPERVTFPLAHFHTHWFLVTAEIMWNHPAHTWDVPIAPIQSAEPFPKTHLNCQIIPTTLIF